MKSGGGFWVFLIGLLIYLKGEASKLFIADTGKLPAATFCCYYNKGVTRW
jgi:hypothetical protein